MSENTKKALVELFPFRVSREELAKRSDEQQAYFSLLNYAASELNVLQRAYISLSHPLKGEEWLDSAIAIQRNTLMRIWSAKLFEILDSIASTSKSGNLDPMVIRLAETAIDEASSLLDHRGYALARNFRHEATSHYSFKAAKKNLRHLSSDANCNLYLHDLDGNSWYPMGEELMFIGRLNRHGANLKNKQDVARGLDDWMEWNLKANGWMRSAHLSAFEEIVAKHFTDRVARKTVEWIDPSLVGEISPPTTPIFFKRAGK